MIVRVIVGALLACFITVTAWAQADPPAPSRPPREQATPRNPPPALPALPADSRTTHIATIGGRALTYVATAGTLTLHDDKGEATGQIFYVAYSAPPVCDGKPATAQPFSSVSAASLPAAPCANRRPLTFAMNGGPGVAAVFLHLAAIGPRLLPFGDGTRFSSDTGELVDNPDSWLAFTDLVFIDPIGTGYSRTPHGTEEENKRFWGVRPDLDSLGQFIATYIAQADRYASPKYLVGESYGGFRVARLASQLASRRGVPVAGGVMISPVLDFSLMGGNDIDILPWAMRLPSMAAAELEKNGQLMQPAGQAALGDAERFALHEYLSGLADGPRAPGADALYAHVAALIGLPLATVTRAEGKIGIGQFVKEHAARPRSAASTTPTPPASIPIRNHPIRGGPIPSWRRRRPRSPSRSNAMRMRISATGPTAPTSCSMTRRRGAGIMASPTKAMSRPYRRCAAPSRWRRG